MRASQQEAVLGTVPALPRRLVLELTAEFRDERLHALRGARRRFHAPELFDDLVDRDDLVRAHQKQCEESALLASAEAEPTTLVQHLEGAQYPEIYVRPPSVPCEASTATVRRLANSNQIFQPPAWRIPADCQPLAHTIAEQSDRRKRGEMDSIDWSAVAAGSAAVGAALVAVIAFSRRKTRRRAALVNGELESEPRRRIDVVQIDAPTPTRKRETKA